MIAQAQDLPPKGAKIEVPGIKVEVTKNDNWETIGRIAVLVLVVYAGIRIIKKIIK
jgi:hypothetical protein